MEEDYFDDYAKEYDDTLNQALALSGEKKDYFAEARMKWLSEFLKGLEFETRSVLDFGCGTGSATPFIRRYLAPERLQGVDPSTKSIDLAAQTYREDGISFAGVDGILPDTDLAFCNGVFHHIPLNHRAEAIGQVYGGLKKGGIFALFENNPWNPVTRYAMGKCEFDRDAITLPPTETRARLQAAGFEILATRYLFFFPAILRGLRVLEPSLEWCPLGAQYVVVARKTGGSLAQP